MKKAFKYLKKLEDNGYEAFIVGGYVRDFLLGKKSLDIDICTNAKPEEIINIFSNYTDANEFGGIVYKEGIYNIEITTYRKELKYNKRKPIKLEFVNSLKEDLPRRDFTINTLCMDKNGQIYDYLSGQKDLDNHKIRSLKDVSKKFVEDPLRMLRAIRLATILDFDIEINTLKAIKKNYLEISKLSNERIKEEFDKILSCPNFKKGLNYLHETKIDEVLGLKYKNIVYVSDLMGMYSQIDVNIKLSRNEDLNISKMKTILRKKEINNFALFNGGLDLCLVCAEILNIDKKKVLKMNRSLPIKKMSDIKLSGADIIKILNIEPSKIINDIIFELKKLILCGKIKNTKKNLTAYVKRKWQNE